MEGSGHGLNKALSQNIPRGTEEKHKIPGVASVPPEVQTSHLSNTSLEYYLQTILLLIYFISVDPYWYNHSI
jgi:hypothetical protein